MGNGEPESTESSRFCVRGLPDVSMEPWDVRFFRWDMAPLSARGSEVITVAIVVGLCLIPSEAAFEPHESFATLGNRTVQASLVAGP